MQQDLEQNKIKRTMEKETKPNQTKPPRLERNTPRDSQWLCFAW